MTAGIASNGILQGGILPLLVDQNSLQVKTNTMFWILPVLAQISLTHGAAFWVTQNTLCVRLLEGKHNY